LSPRTHRFICQTAKRHRPVLCCAGCACFPFFRIPAEGNGAPGGARALRYGALGAALAIGPPARRYETGLPRPAPGRALHAAGLRGLRPGAAPPGAPLPARVVGAPPLVPPSNVTRDDALCEQGSPNINAVWRAGISFYGCHARQRVRAKRGPMTGSGGHPVITDLSVFTGSPPARGRQPLLHISTFSAAMNAHLAEYRPCRIAARVSPHRRVRASMISSRHNCPGAGFANHRLLSRNCRADVLQ
jgi:hypothetical protein